MQFNPLGNAVIKPFINNSFSTKTQAMEEKINQLEKQIHLAQTPTQDTKSTITQTHASTREPTQKPPQVSTESTHKPPQVSTPTPTNTQPTTKHAGTYTSASGEPCIPPQNPQN